MKVVVRVVATTTKTVRTRVMMTMIVVVMKVGWCETRRKVDYLIVLLSNLASTSE